MTEKDKLTLRKFEEIQKADDEAFAYVAAHNRRERLQEGY